MSFVDERDERQASLRALDEERVLVGRADVLARACDRGQAAVKPGLAGFVDVHRAVDLVARGCRPETALAILLS